MINQYCIVCSLFNFYIKSFCFLPLHVTFSPPRKVQPVSDLMFDYNIANLCCLSSNLWDTLIQADINHNLNIIAFHIYLLVSLTCWLPGISSAVTLVTGRIIHVVMCLHRMIEYIQYVTGHRCWQKNKIKTSRPSHRPKISQMWHATSLC
jgi:hypothetical protein